MKQCWFRGESVDAVEVDSEQPNSIRVHLRGGQSVALWCVDTLETQETYKKLIEFLERTKIGATTKVP